MASFLLIFAENLVYLRLSLKFRNTHFWEGKNGKNNDNPNRIDAKVKTEAQKILDKLNISMSEAISMYLTQVTLHKGIPFDMRIPEIPNELTAATLRKSEEGKGLRMP